MELDCDGAVAGEGDVMAQARQTVVRKLSDAGIVVHDQNPPRVGLGRGVGGAGGRRHAWSGFGIARGEVDVKRRRLARLRVDADDAARVW